MTDETVCPGCAKEMEALRKQVAELTKERDAYQQTCHNVANELAAAQAHSVELRVGMFNVANGCRIWGGEAERARKMLEHYLATPDDSSALDRRLQEERERCAKVCDDFPHDQLGCLSEVAALIRSMK